MRMGGLFLYVGNPQPGHSGTPTFLDFSSCSFLRALKLTAVHPFLQLLDLGLDLLELALLALLLDGRVVRAGPGEERGGYVAALRGVGTDTAASLLVTVGDNPQRLKSEASFARLCSVAPVPASSGKTARHRLNRGGNRDANRALHVLALGRMSWDGRTREYVARRTAEGKSKKEILRCLKRYVAREVYRVLRAPGTLPSSVSVP